jgi:hypothetical protein
MLGQACCTYPLWRAWTTKTRMPSLAPLRLCLGREPGPGQSAHPSSRLRPHYLYCGTFTVQYSTVQYSTGLATDRRASTLSPDPLQPSAYNTFQRKSLLPAGPAVPHGLVELLLAAHQAELTLLTRFTAQNIPIHRAVPAPAQCARRPVELSPFGRTWLLHSSAGCSALQHQPPWYTLQENVCLSSALCPPSLPHLQSWPPPIEWTSPPRLRTKCCAEPRSPKSDPLQASCPLRHCVLTMHL